MAFSESTAADCGAEQQGIRTGSRRDAVIFGNLDHADLNTTTTTRIEPLA
ncbi:MAG: hypothetical protein R3F11_28350 [Verrucomicrobiales bacterium]